MLIKAAIIWSKIAAKYFLLNIFVEKVNHCSSLIISNNCKCNVIESYWPKLYV